MTGTATGLLLAFLVAHYLGDFTNLATDQVHEAKARGEPLGPIAGHAAVHGLLVGLAAGVIARPGWGLLAAAVAVEFLSHFAIDAGKAWLAGKAPALRDPEARAFWYTFGADQLAHVAVLVGLTAALA